MIIDRHEMSDINCRDCHEQMTAIWEVAVEKPVAYVCTECGAVRYLVTPYVVQEWP